MRKSFKKVIAMVVGMVMLSNIQPVWAAWEKPSTDSSSSVENEKRENKAQVMESQYVGTMLTFNGDKKTPTLAGVTNKTEGIISSYEYNAARDASSAIRSELKNAWTQDVKSGFSGVVYTTRERKVIDDEVIERVMEKLAKCDPDDVGAFLIPGSETLAGTIKTKVGEQKVEVRKGEAPYYVLDIDSIFENEAWEPYYDEIWYPWTAKEPGPEEYPGEAINSDVVTTEAFNAIIGGMDDARDSDGKTPEWGWRSKKITLWQNSSSAVTKRTSKVFPGDETIETVLEDLFEYSPWFTYGYQKRMYELIKDKAYVESDEFEVSPEIQFYPGSVGDLWEAFEDIVAIGNSDFIHLTTIKNYILDAVEIGNMITKTPKLNESYWEVFQIDEEGERYNIRTITGDDKGNLNVAFDQPGTYYIQQYVPTVATYGNTYYYTYEEYSVEECTGIILDYQTKTDKVSVKYTDPLRTLQDGASYIQPVTQEQCLKNWIVTPDSIRMGNNLYMVE